MKTYVLDAGALFALLELGPGTAKVNELLKDATRGHGRILISGVNYGEVYGLLLRARGPNIATRIMSTVAQLPIEIHDATPQRCLRAAELKITCKLYYVDAFAAALAVEHKATLVTSDSDFRKLGHSFPVLWLKN